MKSYYVWNREGQTLDGPFDQEDAEEFAMRLIFDLGDEAAEDVMILSKQAGVSRDENRFRLDYSIM